MIYRHLFLGFLLVFLSIASGEETLGGELTGEIRLVPDYYPYRTISDVIVKKGARLIIDAGVEIKLHKNHSFIIEGVLQVKGTKQKPVTFTSYLDEKGDWSLRRSRKPSAGNWQAIRFNSRELSELENCEIKYAQYGIYSTEDSRPLLRNVTFTSCTFPIRVEGSSLPLISSIKCFNSGTSGIILSGHTSRNMTLLPFSITGLPYLISEKDFSVRGGDTLVVPGGTIFKAMGENADFEIIDKAYVDFQGTSQTPIVFTSIHDNSIGGTTGNGTPGPGDWGCIYIYNGRAYLEHCVIKFSQFGISSHQNSSPEINNCIISNNNYPLRINGSSFPVFGKNRFSSNVHDGIFLGGHTEYSDTMPSYEETGLPYFISEKDYSVSEGDTLYVQAGTIFKGVSEDADFEIAKGGAVHFAGTKKKPVVFTSINDNETGGITGNGLPTSNDWGSIYVYGGHAVLENCIVRHSSFGVYANQNSHPLIKNSRFTRCQFPLRVSGVSFPECRFNSFTQNDYNGVFLSGQTSGNAIIPALSKIQIPFLLTDKKYVISKGDTIRVSPGAVFKGLSLSSFFEISQHSLVLFEGTKADPIIFTSFHDNSIGGKTGNGRPEPGQWGNIHFYGGEAVFNFCEFRYADYGLYLYNNSGPEISNCLFQACIYPLVIDGSSYPLLSANRFRDNDNRGILLTGYTALSGTLQAYSTTQLPYILTNKGFTVQRGDSLFAEPGCIVKGKCSGSFFKIEHGATGLFAGEKEKPIVFTSVRDNTIGGKTGKSPSAADWETVMVDGGRGVFEYCQIKYASSGISIAKNGRVNIENCEFSYCDYPLQLHGNARPEFNGVTFTDNIHRGIYLSGRTSGDFTLPSFKETGLPFILPGPFWISRKDTLSVPAGSRFVETADSAGIFAEYTGYAFLKGTLESPVLFKQNGEKTFHAIWNNPDN
ncbi:MAG: right-handed parallel beta-helix repeat-containing protein [Fibrobacteria bacterium]|nr:right-handed parallel beta-helix repeat-containing protein [Fibrobacteria bacterium]